MTEDYQMVIQPKPLEYFIKKARIVIDTNILLQAYQWKGVEIEKVLEQLEWFSKQGRLIIPSQVVSEFQKRREGLIRNTENSLSNIINEIDKVQVAPKQSLKEVCPMFSRTDDFLKAIEVKNEIIKGLNEYKDLLTSINNKVTNLFDEDKILNRIQLLIDKSHFLPVDLESVEELERQGEERFSKNIPPGHKDKGKAKNNSDSDPYGDFKIWAHILKIQEDVLFITYDEKNDWFIRGGQGKTLSQRTELSEEFYEKTGYQFRAISAKNIIGLKDFPNSLQVEILKIVGDTYTIETFYDKSEELYQWMLEKLIDKKGIVHIMNDVNRIDPSFVKAIKYSFAEMSIAYVDGLADKNDFQNLIDLSYEILQDRWDSRFDSLY
ncbi:hypothetical protein D3C74_200630 [compost metagenome]